MKKEIIKRKITKKKMSKKRTSKGRWDFMEKLTGKNKYQRAREKQIKLTEKRLRSPRYSAKQKETISEGLSGLKRMNKEYTARDKAERAGVQRDNQDW